MKVVNTDRFWSLIREAERSGFNRTLRKDLQGYALDNDGFHLVKALADHGDGSCLRCEVYVKLCGLEAPFTGLLDVDYTTYERLADAEKFSETLKQATKK